MAAVPASLRRRLPLAPIAAVVAVVAGVSVIATAAQPAAHPAVAAPSPAAVAFTVALRTFEANGVALADQAAAVSASPHVRDAARMLVVDGDGVAAAVWAMLDRWGVPGTQRLPAPAPALGAGAPRADPTTGLRHACGLVGNDELGRLDLLRGAAFDQRFTHDWIAHAQTALQALAGRIPTGVPADLVVDARRNIDRDVGLLASAVQLG